MPNYVIFDFRIPREEFNFCKLKGGAVDFGAHGKTNCMCNLPTIKYNFAQLFELQYLVCNLTEITET